METIELISLVVGIPVAILGIVGGILSLPDSIKRLRKGLRPHGDKGVGFCVVNQEETENVTVFTLLVVEDLFHFIGSMGKPETGAKICSVEQVGEYYKVVMTMPAGRDYFLKKTKKVK